MCACSCCECDFACDFACGSVSVALCALCVCCVCACVCVCVSLCVGAVVWRAEVEDRVWPFPSLRLCSALAFLAFFCLFVVFFCFLFCFVFFASGFLFFSFPSLAVGVLLVLGGFVSTTCRFLAVFFPGVTSPPSPARACGFRFGVGTPCPGESYYSSAHSRAFGSEQQDHVCGWVSAQGV